MARRPPRVFKRYDSLPRNPKYPLQEFRIRVIKYDNSPKLLDLREYVTSENYTDYTPKGVAITKEQFIHILNLGSDILKEMEE